MTTVTAAPTLWLGTSWKMTKTIAEAHSFIDELAGADIPDDVRPFVLPAHTALSSVRDRLGPDAHVLLGAQNAHPGSEGAVTGEVSMRMIRDAGARLVEVGHAERRTIFGETDEFVAAKTAAAVDAGLVPLVCVGETLEQRQRGEAVREVARQTTAALGGIAGTTAEVLVAYEPHWAIGSAGRVATPEQVADVVAGVRTEVEALLPSARSRVLYGGSVDEVNVRELVTRLPIDGLFVGRAAWAPSGFLDLAHRCSAALAARRTEPLIRSGRKEW